MNDRIECPHCHRLLSSELLLPDFDLSGCPLRRQCPPPGEVRDAWPTLDIGDEDFGPEPQPTRPLAPVEHA